LALDQLHREVRGAIVGSSGIEDLRDARVLHASQQLPLDLEMRMVTGVQALPGHQLERYRAKHRLQLLGAVNRAHAATAKQVKNPITAHGGASRQVVEICVIAWASAGYPRRQRLSWFFVGIARKA
jgi:hypothetical protein